ncbi:MAG: PDZ domain-containing protein [Calditrichaeota bacterium]|nr:MAG: PDZ domain-containing protein [Calditrichota bacterium]
MGKWIQNSRIINFSVLSFLSLFLLGVISLSASSSKDEKGFLGVSVQELTASLRSALDIGKQSGLLITSVIEGSPAEAAGIQDEDVIIAFNGKSVELAKKFSEMVAKTGAQNTVELTILRSGKEMKMKVKLGKKERNNTFVFSGDAGMGNIMFIGDRPKLGVEYHDLDKKELAAYFKVEQRSGVLVLDVTKKSAAATAGLLAGDVIIGIDDDKINNGDDLVKTLSEYDGGDELVVNFIRKGVKNSVKVKLDEASYHGRDMKIIKKRMPHGEHNLHWESADEDIMIPKNKTRQKIYKFKSKPGEKNKDIEIIVDGDESI